jgi:hypothetical protein
MRGFTRHYLRSGLAALLLISVVGVANGQQIEYPVILGMKWGYQNPSLDGFNLIFSDQLTPRVVGNTAVTVRTIVAKDTADVLRSSSTAPGVAVNAKSTDQQFQSTMGFGAFAMLRLHHNIFARFDGDVSSHEVWHNRNFGGSWGYEQTKVTISSGIGAIYFVLPYEDRMPRIHIGVGGGGANVATETMKATNTGVSISSGSAFAPMFGVGVGMVYPIPGIPGLLHDRVSFVFDYQVTAGKFDQQFLQLDEFGSTVPDSLGAPTKVSQSINVGGPMIKFGIAVAFGEIKPRGEKGVLTDYLKSRERRGGRFARRSDRGGGGGAEFYGGVVSAAPARINEEQIRSIIRQELQNAQLTSPVTSMDNVAEQQLQVIRQRRQQAEGELRRLRELLREEG